MSFRPVQNNYVNLGRLYSIPPWSTVPPYGLSMRQKNFVNLGNLYAHSPTKYPPGWAYFDDGSVFILPFGWCSHDVFEARMKIITHFARTPTPKMQQIRATKTRMKRFIIIDKNGNDIRGNILRILARNAQDGQRVSVVDPPFENVELNLDPTGVHPVYARFSDAPQLKYEHRLQNSQALETFRGTLIDGILQPNVRLGNGLCLSNKPKILKPQITKKRRARNREANKESKGADSLLKAPAKSPRQPGVPSEGDAPQPVHSNKSLPQRQKSPRDVDLEQREAQLAQRARELMRLQQQLLRKIHAQNTQPYQGKHGYKQRQKTHELSSASARVKSGSKTTNIEVQERALEQQEELLRYKRKTWLLEQKLAQATAPSPPRYKFANPKMAVQERDRDVCEGTGPSQEVGASYTDQDGDQLSDYNFTNPSPPAALVNLRSRIRLPTRTMMQPNRGSGYR